MKKLMIIVVMVAAYVLPTMAQSAQEWQTSTMQGSGSAYAPQVTAVGAVSVPCEATTTTASYSPGKPGIKTSIGTNQDGGEGSNDSPIGDALLPLLLMAMVYGVGCTVYRRKHPRTLKADNW